MAFLPPPSSAGPAITCLLRETVKSSVHLTSRPRPFRYCRDHFFFSPFLHSQILADVLILLSSSALRGLLGCVKSLLWSKAGSHNLVTTFKPKTVILRMFQVKVHRQGEWRKACSSVNFSKSLLLIFESSEVAAETKFVKWVFFLDWLNTRVRKSDSSVH